MRKSHTALSVPSDEERVGVVASMAHFLPVLVVARRTVPGKSQRNSDQAGFAASSRYICFEYWPSRGVAEQEPRPHQVRVEHG